MKRTIVVSFDGACEPTNPGGIASFGYVIQCDGEVLSKGKGIVGEGSNMTNNVAEYQALIEVLADIAKLVRKDDKVEVKGDSQLVIRQMTGRYQVKSPRIITLFKKAKKLTSEIREKGCHLTFRWVNRDENADADVLSHEAFEEYCKERGYVYTPCECGGTMIPKLNSKTGRKFMGCSRFPDCRQTAGFRKPE